MRDRAEFDADPYLRDIVERNLEVAAQCVIDIAHRIIALEKAKKPRDYYEAILRLGEIAVIPLDFARQLSLLAGFRNVLVHEYTAIDWDEVYRNLQNLDDLARFSELIRHWLNQKSGQA
ncbi:MAG: type VII toxin-antitoxin system HepT family RNase toxin [Chloroflexota bacterium]